MKGPDNATWLLIAIGVIVYFIARAAENAASGLGSP